MIHAAKNASDAAMASARSSRASWHHDRRRIGIYLLIVGIVNILVHYPVLRFYPVFDDFSLIDRILDANSFWQFCRAIFLVPEAFYRPAWYVLLYWPIRWSGGSVVVYHAIALCLHVVNAGLVLAIAYELTADSLAALVSGLVFALSTAYDIQPLWLAQAPPGLTCLLLAIGCHISYLRGGSAAAYTAALVLAMIALFEYEAYVIGAPLICLLTLGFEERNRGMFRKVVACIPYAVGVLAYFAVYLSLKPYKIGTEWTFGPETVPRLLAYLSIFVVPGKLRYPETIDPFERWWSGFLGASGSVVAVVLVVIGAWALWRWSRPAGFFYFWTLAGLLPFIFYSTTKDCRYVYLSSVGFAGAVGVCASRLLSACVHVRRRFLRVALSSGVVAALLFGAWTLGAEARIEMRLFGAAGQRGDRPRIVRALDAPVLRQGGVLYFYNCLGEIPLRFLRTLVAEMRPALVRAGLSIECIELYDPRGPSGYRSGYIYDPRPPCGGCIYPFTPDDVRQADGRVTIDWDAVTRNGPLR